MTDLVMCMLTGKANMICASHRSHSNWKLQFVLSNTSLQEYLQTVLLQATHCIASRRRWLSYWACSTHHSLEQTHESFFVGLVQTSVN